MKSARNYTSGSKIRSVILGGNYSSSILLLERIIRINSSISWKLCKKRGLEFIWLILSHDLFRLRQLHFQSLLISIKIAPDQEFICVGGKRALSEQSLIFERFREFGVRDDEAGIRRRRVMENIFYTGPRGGPSTADMFDVGTSSPVSPGISDIHVISVSKRERSES